MSIRLLLLSSTGQMAKAIPPGARWITVRPNGPGTDGQPVLIQPAGDGGYKVVGGAGGSLNHLKLTGVRSEADYAQEVRGKQAAQREEKQRQKERDKADGLLDSKKRAREALKAQVGQHEAKFIDTVSSALGWKPEETRFPEEKYQNASPSAVKKAQAEHGRALYKKAMEAVDTQRRRLLEDAQVRAEGGLGEIPLTTAAPDTLSVQDLDPVEPTTKGFGYSTDYSKRAAERGLEPAELAAEAQAAKPADDGQAAKTEARRATVDKIADELKAIRDPGPQVDPRAVVDARQAVNLLKAAKELAAVRADARKKGELIDGAKQPVEPKAYVIETVSAPVDSDVVKGLENDLRTIKTRAFLSEAAGMPGGVESLGRHIGVGAFNAINAVALAAGGASLLDRSVVDVLGVAGAAQVLARRLQTDLTADELGDVRDAVSRFHVDRYMELSDQALREARDWQQMAAEIALGEGATGADLQTLQELNAKRRQFVANAQSVLGTAYGEMEANAAMVMALGQPNKDKITMSLGAVSVEDAIRQARAIGLERGDYLVERAGNSTVLTVHGSGMDRLATPVAREDLTQLRGALDIIEGRKDEENWLPKGMASRPDLCMNIKPGTAARLAKPFAQGPGADAMESSMRDYIGARAADGDSPAEIVADLLSEDTIQRAGDRAAFMEALDKLAPQYDADGKMIRAETHEAAFEAMADAYTQKLGADRAPIHRQKFRVDNKAVDALHRALAAHPEGVAAFKPIGELSKQDQGALRKAFAEEFGKSDPAAEKMRVDLEGMDAAEPEKETEDMFGRSINPEWRAWQASRNDLAEKLNGASMTWGKYLAVMGSPANAYAAMQDVVRSKVLRAFADAHNTLSPQAPLAVGRTPIAHDLNHLDALDPEARERRLADQRARIDALRNRVAGKYSSGSVADKLEGARAAEEALEQSQMGLFGSLTDEGAGDEETASAARQPDLGERWTIGHAAERQIAGMMPIVGHNFVAGQPVKLFQPNMSGAYAGRQRGVKLIRHNRRQVLGMGVGSGKTGIMLGAFTDLHATGDAHKAIFSVPSVVQGQFQADALTMLEPGKFNWHCDPGADREARIAGYKNPDVHFSVVTHQAFRDDLLHLAAKREGSSPELVAAKLDSMKRRERAAYMKETMAAEGINPDYFAVDEGHNLLNRAGKQNSHMANVFDAVSDNMGTYVTATADPVKNDASEAFDVLAKMDPKRYSDRDAFMRKYGVDTIASKAELQRELARHFYTGKIDPGVRVDHTQVPVSLSDGDNARLKELGDAAAAGRLARINGAVDVEAMKKLSPGSFAGADAAHEKEIAGKLQASIGIVYDAAVHHAINGEAKTEALAKVAGDRRGKPGVVFAHNLDRVQQVAERLRKDGHHVLVLTGADSSKSKDAIKREFKKSRDTILVCSDAAAVGANLQTGQWLAQFDTPQTAMVHAQRNGRIARIGQANDVELLDLIADHPAERKARQRLTDKYALRDVMTSPLDGLDDRGIAGYLNRVRSGTMEAAQPLHLPAGGEGPGAAPPDPQADIFDQAA
jgi:hypothetical protein